MLDNLLQIINKKYDMSENVKKSVHLSLLKGEYYGHFRKIKQIIFKSVQKVYWWKPMDNLF